MLLLVAPGLGGTVDELCGLRTEIGSADWGGYRGSLSRKWKCGWRWKWVSEWVKGGPSLWLKAEGGDGGGEGGGGEGGCFRDCRGCDRWWRRWRSRESPFGRELRLSIFWRIDGASVVLVRVGETAGTRSVLGSWFSLEIFRMFRRNWGWKFNCTLLFYFFMIY